jgi:hypothetical protein
MRFEIPSAVNKVLLRLNAVFETSLRAVLGFHHSSVAEARDDGCLCELTGRRPG